jgi:hypothetical protein
VGYQHRLGHRFFGHRRKVETASSHSAGNQIDLNVEGLTKALARIVGGNGVLERCSHSDLRERRFRTASSSPELSQTTS